jgi:hypothetical protein
MTPPPPSFVSNTPIKTPSQIHIHVVNHIIIKDITFNQEKWVFRVTLHVPFKCIRACDLLTRSPPCLSGCVSDSSGVCLGPHTSSLIKRKTRRSHLVSDKTKNEMISACDCVCLSMDAMVRGGRPSRRSQGATG